MVPHPKAPARGGYEPTYEGMNEWVDDVMFLLGYVADKDIDRYERFLQDTKRRDPAGFNALVGSMYHTEPQQEEDVTVLVPTTTTPPLPTTTVPPPSTTVPTTTTTTTTVPPPTTTVPPPTTTVPVPTTTVPPPTTTITRPLDDRRSSPPSGHAGGTRPHTASGPFWPRVPADWPYASRDQRRRAYEESGAGEDDLTLNMGPDDWGAPPGTAAAQPPGDDISTGALQAGLPEEGPIPAIVDAIRGGIEQGAETLQSVWDVAVRQEWPNTGLRPLDDFMNDLTATGAGVKQG
jgi:hypothetical protein